jgi:hypothetical protein
MTSDNWAILNEIVEILEPIKSFTKKLEGRPSQDKADGVTDVYPAIAIILGKLEKLKVEYAESQAGAPFWVAIEGAWSKANEYYSKLDDTPLYTAAVILDPRLKFEYMKGQWDETAAEVQLSKVRRIRERDYRTQHTPLAIFSSPSTSFSSSQERRPLADLNSNKRSQTDPDGDQHSRKRAKYVNADELLKQNRRLSLPTRVGDELTLYLTGELETDEDPLPFQYWLRPQIKAKYPSLSRLAIDVLSVPAMSSEAERVFSATGFVLNSRRRQLKEVTSEALYALITGATAGL